MLTPELLAKGGLVLWLLLVASAVALVVFIERFLHCHRSQINSTEFLNGVRTVLKRNNVVEALSICDATPGPVARLVKTAIVNREHGRERVREALEEAGQAEVPRLEEKLNLLATIVQLAPLLGLLGTVLGFYDIFQFMNSHVQTATVRDLSGGILKGLVCAAAGLAVAIPTHAGYNYLVSRINSIVLDMERAAAEIVNILTENQSLESPEMKFTRNARIFQTRLQAAPFAAVFFLLLMFLLVSTLLYTHPPGVLIELPATEGLPGTDQPTISVAIDANGRMYFQNEGIDETNLTARLRQEVTSAPEPLTLLIHADAKVTTDMLLHLSLLARQAGITNGLLATLPRPFTVAPVRGAP